MSTNNSYLVSYDQANNTPSFSEIKDNALVYAQNKSFNGLSLPTSQNTANQYVLKMNSDGQWYFTNFVVTSDMEVSQRPSMWDQYGTDDAKLNTNGILVAA